MVSDIEAICKILGMLRDSNVSPADEMFKIGKVLGLDMPNISSLSDDDRCKTATSMLEEVKNKVGLA